MTTDAERAWNDQLRVLDGVMRLRLESVHAPGTVDQRLVHHAATFVQLGVTLDAESRKTALMLLRTLTREEDGCKT